MKFKKELIKNSLSPTLSESSRNGKVCKTKLGKFRKAKASTKHLSITSANTSYDDCINNKRVFKQDKKIKKKRKRNTESKPVVIHLPSIAKQCNATPYEELQTYTEYVVTKLNDEQVVNNNKETDTSHLNWDSCKVSSIKPSDNKAKINYENCSIHSCNVESINESNSSDTDSDDCTIENLTLTDDTDNVMVESPDDWTKIEVSSNDTLENYNENDFDDKIDVPVSSGFVEENYIEVTNDSLENGDFTYDESCDKDTNSLQVINCINGKRLVVLESCTRIYLNGFATIHVIHGCIEILGSFLDETCDAVELYSPRGTSLLYITACICDASITLDASKLSDLNLEPLQIENILSLANEGASVILMESQVTLNVAHLEKHTTQQLFPKEDPEGLRCVFGEESGDWNVVNTSKSWEELSNCIKVDSKVILCGGKGVGKSTLLRYLINNLLVRFEAVKVIDLDPGQPEFTVPGCVSMCVVHKPVFGPSFTHMLKPDECIFVSNIDISFNPEEYLTCIQELLKSCENTKTLPTLINYMGYSRGLGLNLAANVIVEVQPTMLVQIQSRYAKKNFSHLLTPDFVQEHRLPITSWKKKKLSYSFVTMESMSDSRKGWDLQPRQIRELKVLAYLSQSLPSEVVTITSPEVPIFRTSLKDVTLIANGSKVSPAVVNAKFVALTTLRCTKNSYNIYDCHGWGVVRGINLSTDELFLITPEPLEILDKIDFIVYGSVTLPPSVYMTSDDVCDLIPYVSAGVLSSFSLIPRRSYLPKHVKSLDV